MTQFDSNLSSAIESRTQTTFFDVHIPKTQTQAPQSARQRSIKLDLLSKRIFDGFFAFVMIVLTLPIFVLITIAINVSSKGPIFFRQERVGKKGKTFRIWKFRTMIVQDSRQEHQQFVKALLEKADGGENSELVDQYMDYIEKRITPIGSVLRATSLDELPQLFNILAGDMSLVGPRPHPVYEVDEYKSWYRRRLDVKPGLTGWSKLNLRLTPKNYEESILYDLWYVDHWSFFLDLRILLMTVPFVLSMKDAH